MDEVKLVRFVTPSGRALSSTLAAKVPSGEVKITEEQYDQAIAAMGITSFGMSVRMPTSEGFRDYAGEHPEIGSRPRGSDGILDLDRSEDFMVSSQDEDTMIVLSHRHGSFEWPGKMSHGSEIWKFYRQEAFYTHEVGKFGGKAIYKIVGSRLNKEPTRVGGCHSRTH